MSTIPIWQFFNNRAVGAAVGAFLAYFLVAATNLRRRSHRKKLISLRMKILRDIAQQKLETALTNIAMIRAHQFTDAPVMKFPLDDLRVLKRECLDTLSADQINALDTLIYWFEAVDGLFAEASSVAEKLEKQATEDTSARERDKLGEELLRRFDEVERNLATLLTLADWYIDDNPRAILEYEHPRADRRGE